MRLKIQFNTDGQAGGVRILCVVMLAKAGVEVSGEAGLCVQAHGRGECYSYSRADACRKEPGLVGAVACDAFEGFDAGRHIQG